MLYLKSGEVKKKPYEYQTRIMQKVFTSIHTLYPTITNYMEIIYNHKKKHSSMVSLEYISKGVGGFTSIFHEYKII